MICYSDMQGMGIRPHGVLQERHLIYWRRGSKAFEYIKFVQCRDLVESYINICCRWCVIGSLIPGPSILDKTSHDRGFSRIPVLMTPLNF